jgi:hypothetical protein
VLHWKCSSVYSLFSAHFAKVGVEFDLPFNIFPALKTEVLMVCSNHLQKRRKERRRKEKKQKILKSMNISLKSENFSTQWESLKISDLGIKKEVSGEQGWRDQTRNRLIHWAGTGHCEVREGKSSKQNTRGT